MMVWPSTTEAKRQPLAAIRPNTVELTEKVLARSIGAFSLMLTALALPDLLQGDSRTLGWDYVVFVVMIPVLIIAAMVPSKRGELRRFLAGAAAWMVLLGFLLWHLGFIGNGLDPQARPWSWGIAGAGVGLAAVARDIRMAVAYGLLFSVLVLAVPVMPAGTARLMSDSWQDALLTAAMTLAIVAPIWALRGAVRAQDQAAVDAVRKFADAARLEAVSLERMRLDTLTHDAILSTFIVAAQARAPEVVAAARRSAVDALAQLEMARHDVDASDSAVLTVGEWFSRLSAAVARYGVTVGGRGDGQARFIPFHVARALNQAAAEAVRNAAEHAPGAPARIMVRFPADASEESLISHVVVEVADDGPGFDVMAVPMGRMGVKVSIVDRMRGVAGSAQILSRPGEGTLVRLEWLREGAGHGREN